MVLFQKTWWKRVIEYSFNLFPERSIVENCISRCVLGLYLASIHQMKCKGPNTCERFWLSCHIILMQPKHQMRSMRWPVMETMILSLNGPQVRSSLIESQTWCGIPKIENTKTWNFTFLDSMQKRDTMYFFLTGYCVQSSWYWDIRLEDLLPT